MSSIRRVLALVALCGVAHALTAAPVPAEERALPPTSKMCGKCPDGYAVLGVDQDPKICSAEEPALYQCGKIGLPRLAVCGSCPEGYVQVGTSSVPARCGTADGGRMSQCQLEDLSIGLGEPGRPPTCPPNCGQVGTPGQGGGPVPQFQDLREKSKPSAP